MFVTKMSKMMTNFSCYQKHNQLAIFLSSYSHLSTIQPTCLSNKAKNPRKIGNPHDNLYLFLAQNIDKLKKKLISNITSYASIYTKRI